MTRPRVPGRLAPVAPLPPRCDPERARSFLVTDRSELTAAPPTSDRSTTPSRGSGAVGGTGVRSASPQAKTTDTPWAASPATMTFVTATRDLRDREPDGHPVAGGGPEGVASSMAVVAPDDIDQDDPLDRGSRPPGAVGRERPPVTRPCVPGRPAPVAPLLPRCDPERAGSLLVTDRSELTAAHRTSAPTASSPRLPAGASPQARATETPRTASSTPAPTTQVSVASHLDDHGRAGLPTTSRDPKSVAFSMARSVAFSMAIDTRGRFFGVYGPKTPQERPVGRVSGPAASSRRLNPPMIGLCVRLRPLRA